jgi:hypothetical protein
MATRKQRAANRRNAQLSTGPRTPEGPPAQTNSAEQSQISPESAPNPMALNHLPPLAEPTSRCPSPPARNQTPQFVHRMVGVCSA